MKSLLSGTPAIAPAGWTPVPEETFIGLRVSEEKRRSAEEFLCKSGARQGALRIANRSRRFLRIGKVLAAATLCRSPPNRLQSEADGRRYPLWNFRRSGRRVGHLPPKCAALPIDLTGKTAMAICLPVIAVPSLPRQLIQERCTLHAAVWLACRRSVRPNRSARNISRPHRAAASFSKSLTAVRVFPP